MDRRSFLSTTAGATGLLAYSSAPGLPTAFAGPPAAWPDRRALFDLDWSYHHLSGMLLTSHPRPVREAIERYRNALDRNPSLAVFEIGPQQDGRVRNAAAKYLGGDASQIALTDSTTMGLGLIYSGLRLQAGDEVLTTTHDHYATEKALAHASARQGAHIRRIALYKDPQDVPQLRANDLVAKLVSEVKPNTRVMAVTWVHSGSGLKLPIAALAEALRPINARRPPAERVLLCVDGVHGLGVEPPDLARMGCDFFIAGCHKWLFGPRGTGLVWGSAAGWERLEPIIPTFEWAAFGAWLKQDHEAASKVPLAYRATPGGFHSFEHRWALDAAFELHERLGPARIWQHISGLNSQMKEGLAKIPRVQVLTPEDPSLSAGIVCFAITGLGDDPHPLVDELRKARILASTTPYHHSLARFSPGLLNTAEDIEASLSAVRQIANAAS